MPLIKEFFGTKKRISTGATLIRSSAAKLMKTLSVCVPYYIRCIKSNDNREPLGWNSKRVKHQVTYLGLVENIKIKKAGYLYRHYYKNFAQRFGPICQTLNKQKGPVDPQTRKATWVYSLEGPLPPHTKEVFSQICNSLMLACAFSFLLLFA